MNNYTHMNYPPIKVEGKNLEYAKLLLEDYASCTVSELTASTQYFNHESVILKQYPQVSEVLSGIGEVEIEHLQILGKLIYLLGLDPKYRVIKENNVRIWWSPSCIEYKKDIFEILEANLKGELQAIAQYNKHLEIIKDKYIKAVLEVIIDEEKYHAKTITEMIEDLKAGRNIKATKKTILEHTSSKSNQTNDNKVSDEKINEKNPPNREYTLEELKKYYNGDDGNPAYVVVDGIVFDMSHVGAWGGGTHHGLFAGYDHTKDFDTCHGAKMIKMLKEKVPMVGYLKK